MLSTMQIPQNLAPVPSAAESVDCSERSIYNWLAAGALRRWKAGHRTLVDLDELHDLRAPRLADD